MLLYFFKFVLFMLLFCNRVLSFPFFFRVKHAYLFTPSPTAEFQLPFHCQWQDLKDLFRQAGTILRADVALGPDGRSRGFGTVSFASDADAERAVVMFNGYVYTRFSETKRRR